jgi:hypothetical protein
VQRRARDRDGSLRSQSPLRPDLAARKNARMIKDRLSSNMLCCDYRSNAGLIVLRRALVFSPVVSVSREVLVDEF